MANSKLTGLTEATSLATTDEIYAVVGGNSRRVSVENLLKTDLAALASSIAKTAVDVFVYDASLDSDGGAWRKRTQHTSWYNETLNTATRGSRREFPAVAVIVAEAAKVTIYDGDDPSLPMWMVFELKYFAGMLFEGSTSSKSLFALNGQVACGDTAFDLQVVNFISDLGVTYSNSSGISGTFKFPISGRNSGTVTTPADSWIFDTVPSIVNRAVNDVAMTVLPNAPIDPATGLPVPTIAVATAGGVSVIKDDGTVASDSHPVSVQRVAIFGSDLFSYIQTSIGYVAVRRNFYTRTGVSVDNFGLSSGGEVFYRHNSVPALFPTQANNAILKFDNKDFGFNQGLFRLHEDPATPAKGMVAYTTSSFQSGWQNGDIKGAWLSDTVAEVVTQNDRSADPEDVGCGLVSNGNFTTDTTGWTDVSEGTGSVSWDASGAISLNNPAASSSEEGVAYQTISTVVGVPYTLTLSKSGGGSITQIGTGIGGSQSYQSANNNVDVFTTFVATTTTTYITLRNFNVPTPALVDNISVRLADPDRSINANGLAVYGSVTKAAVATGAELMGYSGFSASNYLEQPYNSDLDFGTGDFCVMGWVKFSGASTETVFRRQDAAESGARFGVDINSAQKIRFLSGVTTVDGTTSVNTNTWVFFAAIRSSGVSSVYVNGASETSSASTDNVTNTSAILKVGLRAGGAIPLANGSLALLRISATAPSAAQIAKIYEDEKFLFQENAACTLYGASDAVTALAHDPVTDLLHVGTSQGRSDFAGLRRVNNTTTAVGVSISAVDGLIVED